MTKQNKGIIIGIDSLIYGRLKHDLGFYKGLALGLIFGYFIDFAIKIYQIIFI